MGKSVRKRKIIIPRQMNPRPTQEELRVAWILLDLFKSDVEFIERSNLKTPDFCINGVSWELKSPVGNSHKTIDNLLRRASKQSPNIILSLMRTKLTSAKVVDRVNHYLKINSRGINRIIIITKSQKTIDIRVKLG